MITDKGREIIGKYMLGQVPAYATHIAVGVGAFPKTNSDVYIIDEVSSNAQYFTINTTLPNYFVEGSPIIISGVTEPTLEILNGTHDVVAVTGPTTFTIRNLSGSTPSLIDPGIGSVQLYFNNAEIMQFEAARLPISSKGFVTDSDGKTKLAVSAEIPVEQRIEITEVALWSAGSNTNAGSSDSRIIFPFTFNEGWVLHTPTATYAVPIKLSPLDGGGGTGTIIPPDIPNTSTPAPIFGTNSNNVVFLNTNRRDRQEEPRYLNDVFLARGNSCKMNNVGQLDGAYSNNHIHLDGKNINFTSNSPNDILKFAFSLISDEPLTSDQFKSVRILVEFLVSEINTNIGYARFFADIPAAELSETNRYYVINKKLSELQISPDFSWSNVRLTRVFGCVVNTSEAPMDSYYLGYDALRFENVSSPNPVYAMTGYSVVNDPNRRPITKIENTSSFIEFRFDIGVS